MQIDNRVDKIQEFKKICREHCLKVTPQRIAIYRELLNSATHPAADTIYQIVKKEYTNISFDTVNRTLLTFAKIGLVEVVVESLVEILPDVIGGVGIHELGARPLVNEGRDRPLSRADLDAEGFILEKARLRIDDEWGPPGLG